MGKDIAIFLCWQFEIHKEYSQNYSHYNSHLTLFKVFRQIIIRNNWIDQWWWFFHMQGVKLVFCQFGKIKILCFVRNLLIKILNRVRRQLLKLHYLQLTPIPVTNYTPVGHKQATYRNKSYTRVVNFGSTFGNIF